jgi:hypothetical protein
MYGPAPPLTADGEVAGRPNALIVSTNDARAKAEAKKVDSNSDGRKTDELSETGAGHPPVPTL